MGGLHPSCFPLILLVKQQDLLVINLYIVAWGGGGGLLEGHSTICIVSVGKVFGKEFSVSCLLTPVSHHQPCLQVLKTHLCLPLLPEIHFPCKSAIYKSQ